MLYRTVIIEDDSVITHLNRRYVELVRDIIETYNGTIRVESDLGVGTSFIITLTDHT